MREDRKLRFFERGLFTEGPFIGKAKIKQLSSGKQTSLMGKEILNASSKGDDKVLE